MAEVYLALGSNQQNPIEQLYCAIENLQSTPDILVKKVSGIYETLPIGPEQPNFFNMAALIQTVLSPHALLSALQQLEKQQGRVKTIHWGPRTLDIDILFFDDLIIEDATLTIPHPRLHERDFVLVPLQEIYPSPLAFDIKRLTQTIISKIGLHPCEGNRVAWSCHASQALLGAEVASTKINSQ
jgi:2-amino-4-hydroxy-6-hydroxymethyldihydropteridine diphosphokinase